MNMVDKNGYDEYLTQMIFNITDRNIAKADFLRIMRELNGVEKLILSLELGISDSNPRTRQEVAQIFRASEDKIQQKEERAYAKVKALSRKIG